MVELLGLMYQGVEDFTGYSRVSRFTRTGRFSIALSNVFLCTRLCHRHNTNVTIFIIRWFAKVSVMWLIDMGIRKSIKVVATGKFILKYN